MYFVAYLQLHLNTFFRSVIIFHSDEFCHLICSDGWHADFYKGKKKNIPISGKNANKPFKSNLGGN